MPVRTVGAICVLVCLCGVLSAQAPAGLWLDVPFIAQEKNGCGAATAAMVIEYWRNQPSSRASTHAVADQHALLAHEAVSASDLEHYLQQQEFRTFAFHGSWDDLQHHLEKGRPLIAAVKPPNSGLLERRAVLHYVVVVGLDGTKDSRSAAVLLNDPAQRKLLRQDWQVFAKQWSASGDWLLLALPMQ